MSEKYESPTLHNNVRFDALRNSLYHKERASFLDKLNKGINALVIVLGSGVVEKIITKHSFDGLYVELTFLIVATIQLVFDFGGSAKDHHYLQVQYSKALAEMEAVAAWDSETERTWSVRLVAISADEVQTMRALDTVAFNQALDAMYGGTPTQKDFRLYVSGLQYALRHVLAFSQSQFMPASRRSAPFMRRLFRGRLRRHLRTRIGRFLRGPAAPTQPPAG